MLHITEEKRRCFSLRVYEILALALCIFDELLDFSITICLDAKSCRPISMNSAANLGRIFSFSRGM